MRTGNGKWNSLPILPTWANMASKLKGTSLQHFSEEKLIKWREELQHAAKGVIIYTVDVILLDCFL